MESVPLTLAHTHARNAMLETRKSNPVAASEEHDLAAGEFASASQHCMDAYALRTLRLLEDEHKRLAILLRSQHESPTGVLPSDVPAVAAPSGQPPMRVGDEASTSSRANHIRTSISAATNDLLQQPPRLPGNNRHLQRDKSSIASNLASARGIPAYPRRASPASPTLSAQPAGAQLSDSPSRARTGEARHRERAGKYPTHSKLSGQYPGPSPTDIVSQQIVPAESRDAEYDRGRFAATDETFQKFYSSFEGLISKLSAPLAFAGLPLNTQSPDSLRQKSPADTKVDRHNATSQRRSTNADPDINSIFSRAALRAVREANGEMPSTGAESFYVVPTSGGTVSYAGILSRAEKEARRSSLDDGDEDFVDARETPSSPELRQSLSGSHRLMRDTSERNTKTMEELRMENETLKQLTDQLSKRLHMWEVNAQSSSLALQQSLKAMHHQQTTTSSPTASSAIAPPTLRSVQPASDMLPTVENHEKRIKELEEIIQHSEKERDKAVRENEKLKSVLSRYRDRWEKLKEGAKTRRNATETSAAAGLSSVDSPITTPDAQQGEDDEQSLFAEEQTRSEANEGSD